MTKRKKRTLFIRMSEAREAAEEIIAEGGEEARVILLAEQFLELRDLYKELMMRTVFG